MYFGWNIYNGAKRYARVVWKTEIKVVQAICWLMASAGAGKTQLIKRDTFLECSAVWVRKKEMTRCSVQMSRYFMQVNSTERQAKCNTAYYFT